jgi:hypothetical protein
MFRRSTFGLVGAVVLCGATAADAQIRNFVAYLDGAQETPPNASAASGTGTLVLDESTRQITWSVTATGLSAIDAHVHDGRFGIGGGIVVDLGPGTTSFSGSATLSAAQVTKLIANEYYFNLHTVAFPNGEIRGQISEQAVLDARVGNVGTAVGPAETVLRVGGSAGHPTYRAVKRSPGATTLDVMKPAGGGSGVYAIWIFPHDSTGDTLNAAVLDDGFGNTETLGTSVVCLPSDNTVVPGTCPCPGPPYARGFVSKPIFGAGTANALCLHTVPADPRATTSLAINLPAGTYTATGIILDPNTSTVGPRRVSLTNSVTVVVQ